MKVHPMSVGPTPHGPVQCAPYPLGCLVAYAKAHGDGCLDSYFDFRPITPVYYQDALESVDVLTEPGVFLFSSYVWNHAANRTVAERVKRRFPEALVVFGGPQVPRDRDPLDRFFAEHACIDVVVRGEGEHALAEMLDAIRCRTDFAAVPGLSSRRGDVVHGPDRERTKSLAALPSPYTTGLFDHWVDGTDYMALETNRGCPYGCTFCDWGAATLAKVRELDLARVLGEIDYAGRHRIATVFICDANFGILKRDLEIARHLAATHDRYGFPKVVNYSNAKVVRPELEQIIKTFRDAGLNAIGQIAIQTTNQTVLDIVKRSNIKTSEYDKLVAFFRREQIPAMSDIMVGLPGSTLATCKHDLQFLFDRRIHAHAFPTIVMPNAPMADPAYRERHAIEIDADGFVEASFSFTKDDYARMFDLCQAYKLFANLGTGLFKYLLLFLQLDLGVRALDLVTAWLATVPNAPAQYPVSHRLFEQMFRRRGASARERDVVLLRWDDADGEAVLGNVEALLREALALAAATFGVRATGSDVDAVVRAQTAVLPSRGSTVRALDLPHDVPAYFAAVASLVNLEERAASFAPLRAYGPGTLAITEVRQTLAYNDYGAPHFRLEQPSNLAC
jgi:radical SAM superfamily enzyme YgiQ (UPF0313 family)